MTFGEACPVPAQVEVPHQDFRFTPFTAYMIKQGLSVVHA